MFIMNAQILLFTIATSSIFAIGSSVDSKVTNYEPITLSEKSMEQINEIYGTSDNPMRQHAIDMAVKIKNQEQKLTNQEQKLTNQEQKLTNKDQKINKMQEKMFLNFFLCAITTSKSDIYTAMVNYKIFTKPFLEDEQKPIYDTLELPENIRTLMFHHDGNPPKKKKIEDHLQYHTIRFRNLFFHINRTQNTFCNNLRRLINDKYAKNSNVNITEIYLSFAATIVRDYVFFCGEQHSSLAEWLQRINDNPANDVLDVVFGRNSYWYLNGTHIEHINILRNAVHFSKNLPEIFSYECKNGAGIDIKVPLYDKCGRKVGFTVRPDFLN